MSSHFQSTTRKVISLDESKNFRNHIVNSNESGPISLSQFSGIVCGQLDEGTIWSFYDSCMVGLMKQNGYKLKDADFLQTKILVPFWKAIEANNMSAITTLSLEHGLSPAIIVKKIVEAYIDEKGCSVSLSKHIELNDTRAVNLLYMISISEGTQIKWRMNKCTAISDLGANTITRVLLTFGDIPEQTGSSITNTHQAKNDAAMNVLKQLVVDRELPTKFVNKIKTLLDLEEYPAKPGPRTKKVATKLVTYPHLIPDKRLAQQVLLANMTDEAFGPIQVAKKRQIGEEYELKLQQMLTERGIAYKSEDELRRLGYDKTPDVKLITPIAVDGFVVNWIDSKAIFVDRDMHLQYKLDQFYSYWNRFGPGMVIYWFGYIQDHVTSEYKKFIVKSDFPDNIVMLGSWKPEPPKFTNGENSELNRNTTE